MCNHYSEECFSHRCRCRSSFFPSWKLVGYQHGYNQTTIRHQAHAKHFVRLIIRHQAPDRHFVSIPCSRCALPVVT